MISITVDKISLEVTSSLSKLTGDQRGLSVSGGGDADQGGEEDRWCVATDLAITGNADAQSHRTSIKPQVVAQVNVADLLKRAIQAHACRQCHHLGVKGFVDHYLLARSLLRKIRFFKYNIRTS